MNIKAFIGTGIILVTLIIESFIINYISLELNIIHIIFLIGCSGFICGIIIGDVAKQSVFYFIIIGEIILGSLLGLFLLLTQDIQNQVSQSNGFESLGFILVIVIFIAILIAGMIVLGFSGIVMIIFGMVGVTIHQKITNSPNANQTTKKNK